MDNLNRYCVIDTFDEKERIKLQNIFRLRGINSQLVTNEKDKLMVYFTEDKELDIIRNILNHYSSINEKADNIKYLSKRQIDMLMRV